MSDAAMKMHYDANKKSTLVAYLLWWFLGIFGAHRFYLGATGSAIAQLVITVVSIPLCLFIIGFLTLCAVGVWVIVDAFLIPGMIQTYNNGLAMHLSSRAMSPNPHSARAAA